MLRSYLLYKYNATPPLRHNVTVVIATGLQAMHDGVVLQDVSMLCQTYHDGLSNRKYIGCTKTLMKAEIHLDELCD